MNVYDKIEQIFQQQDPSRPVWVDDVIKELKELKEKMDSHLIIQNQQKKSYSKTDYSFFQFVNGLRRKMRADIGKNIYPEVMYAGGRYGINFNGLMYDKSTGAIIPAEQAKKIYRFLYEHQQKNV